MSVTIERNSVKIYDSEAAKHSPTHGGYPTNPIPGAGWSAAEDEGRMIRDPDPEDNPEESGEIVHTISEQRQNGFNYGSGWKGPLPEIYFDAVTIVEALRLNAHEASSRHWAMETAIRNMRLAESDNERSRAVSGLIEAVKIAKRDGGRDFAIQLEVEGLAKTIDQISPPDPKGYVPHMGIAYAVSPLRKIIKRLRAILSDTDG